MIMDPDLRFPDGTIAAPKENFEKEQQINDNLENESIIKVEILPFSGVLGFSKSTFSFLENIHNENSTGSELASSSSSSEGNAVQVQRTLGNYGAISVVFF